jgi:hypothetical protein
LNVYEENWRLLCFIYASGLDRRSNLYAQLGYGFRLQTSEPPMDFVFLAVGAGMFALFAVYAILLRRV